MSLEVVLTEPLGLTIGFPLVPFLNDYLTKKYPLMISACPGYVHKYS